MVHRDAKGGISEEVHVVPIAPDRTRVMLRQRFPKGPVLSALLQLPGSSSAITWMLQNWNYQVAQKDYAAVVERQGMTGAAASDHVQFFQKWNEEAETTTGQVRDPTAILPPLPYAHTTDVAPATPCALRWQPYFSRWDGRKRPSYGEQNDDGATGTYGLKRSYVKNNPAHVYAPLG